MMGFRQAALAGALVMMAGSLPGSQALGQNREPLVRALELARGSRIGVTVHDIEDSPANDARRGTAGVAVESVESGSPADKAGIKTGDTITEFDGERVRSVRQFSRLVQETPSGRVVPVALSRGGQRVTVNVTAESRGFNDDFAMRLLEAPMAQPPLPPAAPRAPRAPSLATPALRFEGFFDAGRRLGVTIETLEDQLAQYFGVKEGVLVKSVAADSAAQKAGVKAGDVITSINGRQIYEASDVNRALDRTDSSDEFTMEVVRDRKPQTLKGKLEARSRTRSFSF